MILLVALVALLFSCVLLAQRIQSDKAAAEPALARLAWKGAPVAPKDPLAFDAVLVAARAEATNELAVAARTTVSERRVACVKCGKPIRYEAAECPFCLAVQPAIVDIEKLDTDGDGLPDKVELALGLNPQDPSDAAGDLDNDGFTNLEEISAKTDPKDPADYPDPIVKLRVAGISPCRSTCGSSANPRSATAPNATSSTPDARTHLLHEDRRRRAGLQGRTVQPDGGGGRNDHHGPPVRQARRRARQGPARHRTGTGQPRRLADRQATPARPAA
jgi:hypothetical protein